MRRRIVVAAALVAAAVAAGGGPATAAPSTPLPVVAAAPVPAVPVEEPADGTRHASPEIRHDKLPLVEAGGGQAAARAQGEGEPVERTWLALDDLAPAVYPKDYTLRGVGEHIEVWVASDEDETSAGTAFPEGDCRNDRVEITDEQVANLIHEFDTNIYPVESEVFSTPPDRDGTGARLDETLGVEPTYWQGEGDNIVVLVDNVRDENFYDTDNANELPFTAGFFAAAFNEAFDRNVMTIDAFDWLHRTGPNPPHEPVPGDPCTSAPARPFAYEGVFAHEYQHLLEYYEDRNEVSWVNEGLSNMAMRITGYADPAPGITDVGFSAHVQCLLGYLGVQTPVNPNPDEDGGAENSLTWWMDQGDDEVLCDYGAAWTFLELLADDHGRPAITALHREDANGFEGLAAVLGAVGAATDPLDLVHRWVATLALDRELDRRAATGPEERFRVGTLDASVNWDDPDAWDTPGAPPNGADFVRFRTRVDEWLSAGEVRDVWFDGGDALPPQPVEWVVDPAPPDHEGDPALHSGAAPLLDRAVIREVSVPADDPTLTFETRWDIEEGWDFGVVQVSTDGGATWTSLANADTTAAHEPAAQPRTTDHLPGFTGDSGGWRTETFDLRFWAGRDVLLAFRYITDPAVDDPGWWVDDVTVGGQLLSDGASLEGWRSATQVRPTPVHGFTVQLVAYASDGSGRVGTLTVPLGAGFTGRVPVDQLAGLPWRADVVAALVTYDEPTEQVRQYAPYQLYVNGVLQPGGS